MAEPYFHAKQVLFKYPHPKSQAVAYLETLPGRVPLFTKDMNVYLASGLVSFADTLERIRQADHRFYEVIPPNVPVKLFLDIDKSGVLTEEEGATYAMFEHEVSELIRTVLAEECDYVLTSAPKPMVLSATTKAKFSRHLVYPIVFSSMASVGVFVGLLRHKLEVSGNEMAQYIDGGVYTKWRLFRVLGSHKKDKQNALERVTDLELSPREAFYKSLVSHVRFDDECVKHDGALSALHRVYSVVDKEVACAYPGRRRASSIISIADIPPEMRDGVAKLDAYVAERKYKDYTITGVVFKRFRDIPYREYTLTPGLPCPNNGMRANRSNKSYVTANLKFFHLYTRCADSECPKDSMTMPEDVTRFFFIPRPEEEDDEVISPPSYINKRRRLESKPKDA